MRWWVGKWREPTATILDVGFESFRSPFLRGEVRTFICFVRRKPTIEIPYRQGQIRIEMDLQAHGIVEYGCDSTLLACGGPKPLRNCSLPLFCPDIVLGLQEQERECGSEAVQI